MYYRVAIQVGSLSQWQWKSTVLSSLDAVFQWLRLYSMLPHDHLRIFSGSSHEEMNHQLARENQGFESTSVKAAQFLQDRMIRPEEAASRTAANQTGGDRPTPPIPITPTLSFNQSGREAQILYERGISFLEKRRVELEHGVGGDHDQAYEFRLPSSMPQVLAWAKLLVRVQQGEMQP